MKKIAQFILVIFMASILASCATTYNHNSMIQRVVKANKLKDGRVLKVGYKTPSLSSECKRLNKASYNWSVEQFEGMAKFAGGYQKLEERAINYANKHKKVNYASLYIPNERSLMGINITMFKKAYITYYHCKFPPAAHHNPFKS